jgi:hypothetical protein
LAHASGIEVTGGSTFFGGIVNGGTISAGTTGDGIFVDHGSLFSGNISNNSGGRIVAGSSGIKVKLVTTFAGNISNAGTISATGFNGVLLENVATFAGDINNKGTISAGSGGIAIGGSQIDGILPVASFTGNIANIGTINAKTGISILDSTILGAIVDSGTIRASSDGIEVNSAESFWAASMFLARARSLRPATASWWKTPRRSAAVSATAATSRQHSMVFSC